MAREKTSFVDMIDSGAGFASFTTIFLNEAARLGVEDDVLKNAQLHALSYKKGTDPTDWELRDKKGVCRILPVAHLHLSVDEKLVLNSMADSNGMYAASNRIVPYYALNEEDTPAPRMPDNENQIRIVKAKLEPVLQKYIGQTTPKCA